MTTSNSELVEAIHRFAGQNGGVVTVNELADLTETNESAVRRWARENKVRRCGMTFVFSVEKALELAEAFFLAFSEHSPDWSPVFGDFIVLCRSDAQEEPQPTKGRFELATRRSFDSAAQAFDYVEAISPSREPFVALVFSPDRKKP